MFPDVPEKMFYKIRDVARIVDVKPHVLRYWESEFPSLKPQKNRNGQRIYTRKDIDVALEIKQLLHIEKYSIAGARQFLKRRRGSAEPTPREETPMGSGDERDGSLAPLREVRRGLADLLDTLDDNR
ncbi:MAG: MerR family transcriptional regulator [Nitrospinae bacterium]|nr:MerR family transcriptional regulator [Nitrospinota bacterium]